MERGLAREEVKRERKGGEGEKEERERGNERVRQTSTGQIRAWIFL